MTSADRRYDLAKATMTLAKTRHTNISDVPADLMAAVTTLLDAASAVSEPDAAELLALAYTDGGPRKWSHADGTPTPAAMAWAADADMVHDAD